MSGFTNDIMNAENVNFSGSNPTVGQVTTNGQLLIGSTAAPNIRVGTLTAGSGISITNGAGSITIANTGSLNDLYTAKYIVSSAGTSGTGANYTTITAAIAAAKITGIPSTIFIQPGTYTENLTLEPNVNLTSFECDSTTPNVTIVGNCTHNTAGTVSISGIRLQTNSAAFLTVSGSVASVVYLNNCYLNCTNNTGISFTSTDASSQIVIINCRGNLGTTGIALYSMSSAPGVIQIQNLFMSNSGASKTASSNSSGTVTFYYSALNSPISSSSTGALGFNYSIVSTSALADNTIISLTYNGTGTSVCRHSQVFAGTASAISVGTGATLTLEHTIINSSNANAVTGIGTLNYGAVTFDGSSSTINTTNQTRLVTKTQYSTVSQIFTGNGTYTPTTGMVYCQITCIGGGGGGGGAATTGAGQYSLGGGGGAGEYAVGIFSAATVGASQAVTIGALGGGGSGTTGGNGTTTSVGALITAAGGSGGGTGAAGATSAGTAGAGGTGGTGGNYRTPGSYGGSGLGVNAAAFAYSGVGASSQLGQGATNVLLSSGNGVNAAGYGSGGSGAMNLAGQGATKTGGSGTAGVVVIQEYVLS